MKKSILALALCTMLVLNYGGAYAATDNTISAVSSATVKPKVEPIKTTTVEPITITTTTTTTAIEKDDENEVENEVEKEGKDETDLDRQEKRQSFNQEREYNKLLIQLRKELFELLKKGDLSDETLMTLKNKIVEYEKLAKELRLAIRDKALERYSSKELKDLEEVKIVLEDEYKDLKVINVESVISNDLSFKFDTPPVIKEGRTLLPLRAISVGFKADVNYNVGTKTVTIKKDTTTIIYVMGSKTININGVDVALESKIDVMNSRTYVPLRIIAEALKVTVEYNDEDKTIKLIDESLITK